MASGEDKVLLKSLYTNSVDNLLLLTGWKQDSDRLLLTGWKQDSDRLQQRAISIIIPTTEESYTHVQR